MRHTAPARRLLSIFLITLIVFPNLWPAPPAHAASSRQARKLPSAHVEHHFDSHAAPNGDNAGASGDGQAAADSDRTTSHDTLSGFTSNPPANGRIAYNRSGAVNASPEEGVYLIDADGTGDTKIPGTERDHALSFMA